MSLHAEAAGTDIVAILCSPGGTTTAHCLEYVIEGCRRAGARTQILNCGTGEATPGVVEIVERAHGLLFAAPTYRGQAAWPLKMFLDNIPRARDGSSVLQGKVAGTLITADSAHHYLGAEPTKSILSEFFGMQVLSPNLYLTAGDMDHAKSLTAAASELARDYGQALASFSAWLRSSPTMRRLRPLV